MNKHYAIMLSFFMLLSMVGCVPPLGEPTYSRDFFITNYCEYDIYYTVDLPMDSGSIQNDIASDTVTVEFSLVNYQGSQPIPLLGNMKNRKLPARTMDSYVLLRDSSALLPIDENPPFHFSEASTITIVHNDKNGTIQVFNNHDLEKMQYHLRSSIENRRTMELFICPKIGVKNSTIKMQPSREPWLEN